MNVILSFGMSADRSKVGAPSETKRSSLSLWQTNVEKLGLKGSTSFSSSSSPIFVETDRPHVEAKNTKQTSGARLNNAGTKRYPPGKVSSPRLSIVANYLLVILNLCLGPLLDCKCLSLIRIHSIDCWQALPRMHYTPCLRELSRIQSTASSRELPTHTFVSNNLKSVAKT